MALSKKPQVMKRKHALKMPGVLKHNLKPSRKKMNNKMVGGIKVSPQQEAFELLRPNLQHLVHQGHWPGVAACVFVGDRLRMLEESGFADIESQKAMTSKSLVRIYSMTKCIVAAAVLQLVDHGKLGLDDRLCDHLPAFTDMHVVLEDDNGLPNLKKTVPASKPITIRHLLTHTSGIASHYAKGLDGPRRRNRREMAWSNIYKDLVAKVDNGEICSLDAWVSEVAKLPLWSHPGMHYGYGYSYDILGHIVEVKTRKPLARYLQENVFRPLSMSDTHFDLTNVALGSDKTQRLATLYRHTKSARFGSDGCHQKLVPVDPPFRKAASKWLAGCRLPSGGGALSSLEGGLLSTLDDYSKFLLTVIHGGKHPKSGVRILSPKMAQEMLADQTARLHPRALASASPYEDRGLGLSCLGELQRKGCPSWGSWFDGVPGVRLWGGAASTAFKYDPNNGNPILVVLMTQAFPQDDGKTISTAMQQAREACKTEEVETKH